MGEKKKTSHGMTHLRAIIFATEMPEGGAGGVGRRVVVRSVQRDLDVKHPRLKGCSCLYVRRQGVYDPSPGTKTADKIDALASARLSRTRL